MHAYDLFRRSGRLTTAGVALAVAVPASLGMTQSPASAAPLPAAYSADASSELVDLSVSALGLSLAGARIGHSESVVTSSPNGTGTSRATSANLAADLLGQFPVPVDSQSVTAPPSADPPARTLAPVGLSPLADIGVISGDIQAAWAGAGSCVPAVGGTRTLSTSRTTLDGSTVADLPALGALAEVQASATTAGTYLVDDGNGGSDVVSRATTTVGDVDILGGEVSVRVTSPVVMEARSDGTTGTAGFSSPPTIVAHVGTTEIPIPLNGQPQPIGVPNNPLVNLTVQAFAPNQQSSGATGRATLDALFRIDLEVLNVLPSAPSVADVSLAVAPMSVEANAPTGGVECAGGPSSGSVGAPDITSPAPGATVTDSTPPITGTGQPGATVTVTEGGSVLCTAVVANDGTWSCSPTTPLTAGSHTVTATQTDGSGTASAADTTTFTVVPDPLDPDGDGLPTSDEGLLGTDPTNPDTDGDGLTDGDEVTTHDTDPANADSDGDGLTDGAEVTTHGTQPTVKDTDKDGLTDGQEVKGVKIRERFQICGKKNRKVIKVTTDPLRKDTDRDGLKDGKEVKGYKIKQRVKTRKGTFIIGKTRTDPTKKDTDRDGVKDKVEKTGKANKRFDKAKSDPSKCDTDQGGISDGAEIKARSNPADVKSGPRNPRGRAGSSDRLPHGIG